MLTIFTPAFNRSYTLPTLYESLKRQTCMDFEWIIVDDGSTDNTEIVIQSWLQEKKFNVRYIKQDNGGKHRAINRGIKEAKGELFFIVDSDDFLTDDAVEKITIAYNIIRNDNSFCGVCPLKVDKNLKKIGGNFPYEKLDCSYLDFRYKYRITGDMAEVMKTEVLRKFPFPEIVGERFCPEALVWNRIGMHYKFRYTNDKVYICEYLPDGLTAKITKIRMQSPVASCICYKEQASMPIPFDIKLKSAINYWRFWFCPSIHKKPSISPFWWWVIPLGFLMHLKDIRVK